MWISNCITITMKGRFFHLGSYFSCEIILQTLLGVCTWFPLARSNEIGTLKVLNVVLQTSMDIWFINTFQFLFSTAVFFGYIRYRYTQWFLIVNIFNIIKVLSYGIFLVLSRRSAGEKMSNDDYLNFSWMCGALSCAVTNSIIHTVWFPHIFRYVIGYKINTHTSFRNSNSLGGLDCTSCPLLGEEEEDKDKDSDIEYKKTTQATITNLLMLSKPDWVILSIAFLNGIIAAILQAYIPNITGRILDHAALDINQDVFKQECILFLIVCVACALFSGIRGGLFTYTSGNLNIRIRQKLLWSLLHQEIGFYDDNQIGEITSRQNNDTSTMAHQISLNLNVFMRSIVQSVFVLLFMFQSSWQLTIITFCMIPLTYLTSHYYGKLLRRISEACSKLIADASSIADEALTTMTTVKAFGSESYVFNDYTKKMLHYLKNQRHETFAYTIYALITTILQNIVTAVVMFYGGHLVFHNKMKTGALISFMFYQQSLAGAFQAIGDVVSGLMSALGSARKVFEWMYRVPKISPPGTYIPPETMFQGEITFDNVVFSYPSRPDIPVLKGINLSIQPGTVVALVGKSGGGKSSIIKLIEHFYEPLEGNILLDKIKVQEYDQLFLSKHISIVSQESILYNRSILKNILYGIENYDETSYSDGNACILPSKVSWDIKQDDIEHLFLRPKYPNMDEIITACRIANIHDFIINLPEGYNTNCGDRGVQLSGGQKQRICIARAIIRNSSILLLDEATSALDTESESLVQKALDNLMQNKKRTIVVIAHRLSTVKNAHNIIVIENGTVAEQGKHDELLLKEGVYWNLVKSQLH